jgi:anthranilate synthase component 1
LRLNLYDEVKKVSRKGNVIPIYRRISADLDTPVSAYIRLTKGKKHSFLLESIEGGEKLARYSFIGLDPFLIVEGSGDNVTLHKGKSTRNIEVPPSEFLKELFSFYKPVRIEGLPRFTGGAVGYFSYDTVRWTEAIPDNNPDSIGMPDYRFGIYQHLIAFDHLKQEIILIANILHEHEQKGLKKKHDEAVAWIEATENKLTSIRSVHTRPENFTGKITPHTTMGQFEKIVRKAKHYIKEGDIFQVVLSQRWTIDSRVSPLTVYRRLRRINPSPYMFLLNMGDEAIIGSSPEMMVRIEQNTIETRPIAGTRPRGKTERQDDRMIAELMADQKELAEHTMLLDLGRNDVGRVSKPGSVEIREQMKIEKYSHVIHIVSSVAGKLKKGRSPIDGHMACFPAGTVSGAPKVRAMEIIDELEQERRGVYAGSIAYIDFWGNLDSCIAIRTVVRKGNKYYVQAGAGIVADSSPAKEFRETEAKAKALMTAITSKE